MKELSVKSDLSSALSKAWRIAREEGFTSLLSTLRGYCLYHLRDKWRFVYFEYPLEREFLAFEGRELLTIKIATREDFDRIERDIFPSLVGDLEYDKRYFKLIGQEGIRCFLGEKDGKLIHYSWVFLSAFNSPIMEVPFDKTQLRKGDIFIGPVFTHLSARGLWVYPCVLSAIIRYLRQNQYGEKVLIFVDGRNAAARPFYERLGFREIPDAVRANWLYVLRQKVTATIP